MNSSDQKKCAASDPISNEPYIVGQNETPVVGECDPLCDTACTQQNNKPYTEYIFDALLWPVSEIVDLFLPSLSPQGIVIRATTTTTSYVLWRLGLNTEKNDIFISRTFNNPVQSVAQYTMSTYNKCVDDGVDDGVDDAVDDCVDDCVDA